AAPLSLGVRRRSLLIQVDGMEVLMSRKPIAGILALAVSGVILTADVRSGATTAEQMKPSPVGVWDVRGKDSGNTRWIGTLVLTTGDLGTLVGHVDWFGSEGDFDGASGREYVSATFDPKTRILKLMGTKLEYPRKITLGTYRAELTEDGLRLE